MINVRKYLSRTQESIGGAIPSGLALFVVTILVNILARLLVWGVTRGAPARVN